MKAIFLAAILLGSTVATPEQPKPQADACKFKVVGDSTVPSITGPENLTPLVYVVDQPDSPIEIVSVDLEGMWLSVVGDRYSARHCAKFQVRNRSNQVIRFVEIMLALNGRGGFGATDREPISPGQTVEIRTCNGGGYGGAPENSVKILVSFSSIGFADCMYRPSVRIPRDLGIQPVWAPLGW